MKFIFLSVLFLFVSCSGGDGGGNNVGPKVTSGNTVDENAAKEYITQSTQTLPPELKLSNEDNALITSELNLTTDETNTLNQL